MRVNIRVNIYKDSNRWDELAVGELDVTARDEGLKSVNWQGICAGLVEGVMAEAVAKAQAQAEEAKDDE